MKTWLNMFNVCSKNLYLLCFHVLIHVFSVSTDLFVSVLLFFTGASTNSTRLSGSQLLVFTTCLKKIVLS